MILNFAEIFYCFVLTEILKTEVTHGREALCFDEKFTRQISNFHLAHKQTILTFHSFDIISDQLLSCFFTSINIVLKHLEFHFLEYIPCTLAVW